MPSPLHRDVRRLLLGKKFDKYAIYDTIMDSTARISGGRRHRQDFVHNPLFIALLSRGNPDAVASSLVHLAVDKLPFKVDRDYANLIALMNIMNGRGNRNPKRYLGRR